MKTIFYTLLVVCLGLFGSWDAQAQTNCPPLTPFCQDLNTAYMPGACMVEVWAKDFISKINDGDTDLDDFFISFDPDELVMSKIFRSEDGKEQTILIYIKDECGISTICEVELDINDNTGECPDFEFGECPIDLNPWCGYAIVTCSASDPDQLVGTIIDVRNNNNAPLGDDWTAPVEGGDTLNMIRPPSWRLGNLGQVFGMARKVQTGEIFFGASDIYAYDYGRIVDQGLISVGFPPPTATGSAGPAGIYKTMFDLDENSISISPVIFTSANQYLEENEAIGGSEIPNFGNFDGALLDPAGATNQFERFDSMGTTTGNGLGNLSYDPRSNHIFASNLEDGKLYSINCKTKTITDVFDPFDPYVHAVDGQGIVTRSERVWGLGIRQCEGTTELYFARNNISLTPIDHISVRRKSIYKVEILSNGRFAQGNGEQDFVINVDQGTEDKITDISFDRSCTKMLLAERGHPHKASVFEYLNNGQGWISSQQFYVGIYDESAPQQPGQKIVGTSSGGGTTYGPASNDDFFDAQCDATVWSTVQCGNPSKVPGRCDIYGLQGISSDGNDTLTSGTTDIYVGLQVDPGNSVLQLKNNLGDVDIFECCCPEGPMNPKAREMAIITGKIVSSFETEIVSSEILIQGEGVDVEIKTDERGIYKYESAQMHNNYNIEPQVEGDILDGLTTLDLIEIQRHILGVRKFNSPYKIIAADINNSGNVSSLDLIELRKILIGKQTEFSNNDVWNAVGTEFDELVENPYLYDSFIELVDISHDMHQLDFVAVKTGDVNGDNSLENLSSTRNSREEMWTTRTLHSKYQTFVEVYAGKTTDILGFQLSLFASKQAQRIISNQIDINQENFNNVDNNINLSWSTTNSVTVDTKKPLFTLVFQSLGTEVMIGNSISSEVYNSNLGKSDIILNNIDKGNLMALIVSPNPTTRLASLHVHSNETQKARIVIHSLDGRHQFNNEIILNKGQNEIVIDTDSFNSRIAGISVVQLITASKTYTTKMIRVE